MYASKSFCNVDAFVSNVPGVNSPIGELTTYARTFTREFGAYQDVSKPGYDLMNFKSASDDGSVSAMPQNLVNQAIALVKYVVDKTLTTSGQIYQDELLTELQTWADTNSAFNVSIGPVRNHDNRWVPDWIKWGSSLLPVANENTVWIAIDSFEAQYSDFDIEVVPPFDNLDLFFSTGTHVEQLLSQITTPQTMDRIQAAKNGNPETILRADDYTYYDPQTPTRRIPVSWPVLIYGPAGNNIDSVKDALAAYILAHSTHTRAEWTLIFPDIFKRTEFIIAPRWNAMAIPNSQIHQGIFSPIVNPIDAYSLMKLVASQYAAAHVDANMLLMSNPYQSIMLQVIGGAENRDGLIKINQVFPDYISVATGSIDFDRQDPTTQEWSVHLNQLLILAKDMHEYTTMPPGYSKLIRDGVLYAVKSFQNIQYLVASRKSVYQLLGITP